MEMNEGDILSACTPRTWEPMTSEMKLFHLSETSKEFKNVVRKVNRTLNVPVKSVLRIENPYLWGCYQLKKLEYITNEVPVREMELFHCTAQTNIPSIATNNLNWRKCIRSRFGEGISFSPSAAYANYYANQEIGMDRALILTTVLVGREILGEKTMSHPPKLFDTSFGRKYGETIVYVKYCDYEFYPSYVAYYTNKSGSELIRYRTDPYHQYAWYPRAYNNYLFWADNSDY
ncbi:hypothetical protein R5R35_003225 [Gryllus longicercus]|uniref:Poly [ADP-ribose] polymerase n=1 Tax=Gryllus longicercus TaxID=2509291 RepID=A0AAN9VPU9_9ORTH